MKFPPLAAVAAALSVFAVAATASAAIPLGFDNDGKITINYDPDSGNITVDTDGVAFGTITLSATGSFFTNNVSGTSPLFYSDDNGDGTSFFFGVLSGSTSTNVTLPGVMDTNQFQSTLLNGLTVASVTNGPASSQITFAGGIIPEPASLSLLALSGIAALRRRR